jgi:Fe-Mn family superoxide dismutase
MLMLTMTRRQLLQTAGAGAAALALSPLAALAQGGQQGGFTLPKLPYPEDALEPHIDAKTMQIHHGRHHQAYVDNLNKALAKHPQLLKMPIDDLLRNITTVPKDIYQAVVNNGGGHYNHTMFWQIMKPRGGGQPNGALARAIDQAFGGWEQFQRQLSQAAISRFGSGWGWLVASKGKLEILSTANQDCPLMKGQSPILGIDVWEHAYYLKYQNRRADYVKAWWNVINWDAVTERFNQAQKG